MARNRPIGIYLGVVGLAVAIQFVSYPLYGNSSDAGTNIWLVLDWLMAIGLLLMLITTYQRKQMSNGDGASGACCSFGADAMFCGTAILALAFFPNWFGEAFTEHANIDAAWTVWHLIDSVLPVLFITEARRLLRTS